MKLASIMELIPSEEISAIGKEIGVDSKNSKITGSFILKSFIRCSLLHRPISLRSIESMCNNRPSLSDLLKVKSPSKSKIDHSSLGKRLNKINPDYFAKIYESVVSKADKILPNNKDKSLYRFDSTITTFAGRLIKDGLNAGGTGKENQIKLTIGVKGCLPSSVRFCEDPREVSEDIALVKAINAAKLKQDDVLLFDRGISKNSTYQDFSERGIKFVTRIKCNRTYHVVEEKLVNYEGNLQIISDEIINFYNRSAKPIDNNLRLIKAINANNTEIWFLSNLLEASILDITGLYARRWDIEVFFKFIKQHLQFKQFISHSLNGMKVYMYCLLIAAILFLLFKHLNNKTGFKIAMLEFTMAIEKEIIKDIILISGGNLQLVQHLL